VSTSNKYICCVHKKCVMLSSFHLYHIRKHCEKLVFPSINTSQNKIFPSSIFCGINYSIKPMTFPSDWRTISPESNKETKIQFWCHLMQTNIYPVVEWRAQKPTLYILFQSAFRNPNSSYQNNIFFSNHSPKFQPCTQITR